MWLAWGTSTASSANVPSGIIFWDGTDTAALSYKTTANPGYSWEASTRGEVDDNQVSGTDFTFSVTADATNITLTVESFSAGNSIYWIAMVE
jgi:hypothetical protein